MAKGVFDSESEHVSDNRVVDLGIHAMPDVALELQRMSVELTSCCGKFEFLVRRTYWHGSLTIWLFRMMQIVVPMCRCTGRMKGTGQGLHITRYWHAVGKVRERFAYL
jgi:hypothetical protein